MAHPAEARWHHIQQEPPDELIGRPETSCIAVLEAMAAGCWVVTRNRAALPETTAGFARLIASASDRETYRQHFVEATVERLKRWAGPEQADVERHLRRQVTHVHQAHTWPTLAGQWVQWLGRLRSPGDRRTR